MLWNITVNINETFGIQKYLSDLKQKVINKYNVFFKILELQFHCNNICLSWTVIF